MSAKFVVIAVLLLLPALTQAQPPATCPQSGPLSEDQLTKLVKNPVPRTVQLVASCGIDFEPDQGVMGRLRSAGAPQTVLDAVRAATGPAERLWDSIKDSQDAAAFENYLRRYPEGQFAAPARQRYRDLRVAGMRAEMERTLAAGQWDAAEGQIRDLLRAVSENDEIRGWQRRVADGRETERKQKEAAAVPILAQATRLYSSKEYLTALPLLKQSAGDRNGEAMNLLGDAYEYGRGAPQDLREAFGWYTKASDLGNTRAMYSLGRMYSVGRGVTQDNAQAMSWFRKSADAGNEKAMARLGLEYQRGELVTRDWNESWRWMLIAAEHGDADSMYSVGVAYSNGGTNWGVARDLTEARKWLRRSADAGSTAGMEAVARDLWLGNGVSKDIGEAMKWYLKAVDSGDLNALCQIGFNFESGQGVPTSFDEAMKWYRKAADSGSSDGMYRVGQLFDSARGVPQDYVEAMKWYRKAADGHNIAADTRIGELYEKGLGVQPDQREAVSWYRKAAAAGYRPAKDSLQRLGVSEK